MTEKEQLILQMYASSRKKKIVIISSILVLFALVGLTCFYFVVSSQSFDLKQEVIVIEYGEKYLPVLDDFVILNDEITTDNTSFECDLSNEEGKDYAEVGKYTANITHTFVYEFKGKQLFERNVCKSAEIIVQDTTAPVFDDKCPSELTFMQVVDDADVEDISKYFTASDLSGVCDISISDNDVDYKTAGNYVIEAVATDNSENKTTMKCNIVIYAPELSINKNDIELMVGESDSIEITYKGKDKPTIINSDDTVASIDENGNITALLQGKCYISIKCNGLTEICNIKVNPKPVEQITQAETTTRANTTTQSNNSSSNNANRQEPTTSRQTTDNYPEKDFLFTDGYTMDNVTEAATAYLKASGKAGSCIPLKNSEGIYIGMRVVFD